MANSEEREKNIVNENSYGRRPRPHFQTPRPPYMARGRGRHDPHIAKAMHNFGVTDLRELLDRKHHQIQISVVHSRSRSSERQPLFRRHDYRSKSTERRPENSNATFIDDVDNIQVEVTTSTGHRNLRIDQDKKLSNLVHVPDHEFSDQHAFARGRGRGNWRGQGGPARGRGEVRGRGGFFRGRGGDFRGRGGDFRGRGGEMRARGGEFRGRGRSYDNAGNMGDHANFGSIDSDNYGQGRARGHYRGRRGQPRGRSHRGNRGRGQPFSREEDYNADPVGPTISTQSEVVAEENWDDDSFSTPVAAEQNDLENCIDGAGTAEHDEFENSEDNYSNPTTGEHFESYEDENEIAVNNDNLIITYPTEDHSKNRVVRLSLPQSDEPENLNQYSTESNIENNEEIDLKLNVDSSDVYQVLQESENNSKEEADITSNFAHLEIETHQDEETAKTVPISSEIPKIESSKGDLDNEGSAIPD